MLIRFGAKEGYCKIPDPSVLYFEMLTAEQLIAFEKALSEEPDQNSAACMRPICKEEAS